MVASRAFGGSRPVRAVLGFGIIILIFARKSRDTERKEVSKRVVSHAGSDSELVKVSSTFLRGGRVIPWITRGFLGGERLPAADKPRTDRGGAETQSP